HARIADPREGPVQANAFRARQKLNDFSGSIRLGVICAVADGRGDPFQEIGRRHLQSLSEELRMAEADAIDAFFVFLDLLKADAESFAKFSLAHANKHTARTQAASDGCVDRIGDFHHRPFLWTPSV